MNVNSDTPFQPPYWARLGGWLFGVAVFANETFIEPQPRFPLLVLDVVFLMGASPKVVSGIVAAIRGMPPQQPDPKPPQSSNPEGSET